MLTCKEASYLASKQLDGKLAWRERMGLSLHIAMCSLCRRYAKDIKKLRIVLRKAGKSGRVLLSESVKLSPTAHKRIRQILQKSHHQVD